MKNPAYLEFLRFLRRGDKDLFDIPKSDQQAYLESLPEPQNDLDRSYYQFLCQSFFWPKWKRPVYDCISLLAYFPVLMALWIRGLIANNSSDTDSVSDLKGMSEVIPVELHNKYRIDYEKWSTKGMLRANDLSFVIKVFLLKFPNVYFSLKVLLKVAQYSELINCNNPRAIITHAEFSFASSLLTNYCNKKGVKHINVMHGEKLYHIYDAFFHFNECYVWNDSYQKLFVQLRAFPTQFHVSIPPSLCIDINTHKKGEFFADYKYYLGELKEEEFASVVNSMNKFKKNGKTIRYRVHPRYLNDLTMLERYVSFDEIENPREISIFDSVSNCSFAVSTYSTVLAQAYLSGVCVVLDDVTFKNQYDKLAEYGYWLITKNCTRLSTLQ